MDFRDGRAPIGDVQRATNPRRAKLRAAASQQPGRVAHVARQHAIRVRTLSGHYSMRQEGVQRGSKRACQHRRRLRDVYGRVVRGLLSGGD